MKWVIEHSAETVNKFSISFDGKTPCERIKGKKYRGTVVEFGRTVFHRFPGKVEGGSMEPRWEDGVWLGNTFQV